MGLKGAYARYKCFVMTIIPLQEEQPKGQVSPPVCGVALNSVSLVPYIQHFFLRPPTVNAFLHICSDVNLSTIAQWFTCDSNGHIPNICAEPAGQPDRKGFPITFLAKTCAHRHQTYTPPKDWLCGLQDSRGC